MNPRMKFEASVPHSIGMELEFQQLDTTNYTYVDGILPLMKLNRNSSQTKPEIIQDTVEVASKVCYSIT